jgi:hypothetical protein
MIAFRFTKAGVVLALALMASGCGTPREKTAPCKRPANLSSYAQSIIPCGPMAQLNADRAAALAAIEQLAEAGNE